MRDTWLRSLIALTDGMQLVEDGFYLNEHTGDSVEYVTRGTRILDAICDEDGWYEMRDGVVHGPIPTDMPRAAHRSPSRRTNAPN